MSRSLQNLTLAVATFAVLFTIATSAEACGGRSRGGYSSHRSTSYHRAPAYRAPVYQAPVYQTPVYRAPAAQPVVIQQPVQQQIIHQVAPAPVQVAPSPVQAAPIQVAQVAAPQTSAEQSALAALAAMGGNTGPVASTGMPQFAPATDAASTGTAGNWTATLANGSTVQLQLTSNGTFRWVANNGGKVSSFDGNFTLSGGQLTLIRSTDNQQLAGAWSPQTNGGANFKLAGAKDNGLNFIRG